MAKPPKIYREDENHKMEPVFLPNDVYAQAIAALVIYCADAVIVDIKRRTFRLPKRHIHPMPSIWVIGGRVLVDEDSPDAVTRNFRRETRLDLPTSRFTYMRTNRYRWSTRAQEPRDVGCDGLADIYFVELTEEECRLATENLDPSEYDLGFGLQEFNRERLVAEAVHPMILDLYDEIFPHRAAGHVP